MCGYFCIEFIGFMFSDKTSTDFTNIFAPNNFKKNDEYFKKVFYDKCLKKWLSVVLIKHIIYIQT